MDPCRNKLVEAKISAKQSASKDKFNRSYFLPFYRAKRCYWKFLSLPLALIFLFGYNVLLYKLLSHSGYSLEFPKLLFHILCRLCIRVYWLLYDFMCKYHVSSAFAHSFARTNCLYLIKRISFYCIHGFYQTAQTKRVAAREAQELTSIWSV